MLSAPNVSLQTFPFNVSSLTSSLMVGSSQALFSKPVYNDSILNVFKQFENGTAQKYLKADWKNSSVTWLGKLLDKYIWKAGEYSENEPLFTKAKLQKTSTDNFLENPENSKSTECTIFSIPKKGLGLFFRKISKLSESERILEEFKSLASYLSCSLKVAFFISTNECTFLPDIQRKTFCPHISPDETICLPVAVSSEKWKKPYCPLLNPHTVYVHFILNVKLSEKVTNLYNECLSKCHYLLPNNCLMNNPVSDKANIEFMKEEWGTYSLKLDLKRYKNYFNTTVTSKEEINQWEKQLLVFLARDMIRYCDWEVQKDLFQEKFNKFFGDLLLVSGGMMISTTIFCLMQHCLTRQHEQEIVRINNL